MSGRGERGAALVVALWSAVILALLAAGLARLVREDLALARNLNEAIKAELAADSGVAAALHALSGPAPWPADGAVRTLFLDGAEIRVAVTDEARRLDLNHASEPALAALLAAAGEGEASARRLAAGLVAKRADEADGETDGEGVGDGAPAFALVRDLLTAPGVSPALFARIEEEVTVYGGAKGAPGAEANEAERIDGEQPTPGSATGGTGTEGPGRLYRIRAEAMTRAGAVAVRIGVFALRAAPRVVETRLWTRGERRLFPAPDY